MIGRIKATFIGSGSIGLDLMTKIKRYSDMLEMGACVGINPCVIPWSTAMLAGGAKVVA